MARPRVVLISTADWDHPVQTNKQHVGRALAKLGWEVLYVESLALRPLSARVEGDGSRIAKRLRGVLRGIRRVDESISVVSPLVLPAWGRRFARALNQVALGCQAVIWRLVWGRPSVILIYSPVGGALLPPLRWSITSAKVRTVYHCVDDIAAQPDMPSDLIDEWERKLVRRVDGVVTTAPSLTKRVSQAGAHYVLEQTNVVDYDRFDHARSAFLDRPATNVVGFVGAISLYKFNIEWVIRAAKLRPGLEFRLYGPIGEGEAGGLAKDYALPPNVRLMGPVQLEDVPEVMSSFDVGIIPAPLNRYTESMFPMKFFEYLACGIPVVASALPSLRQFSDTVTLADSFEDFVEGVDSALASQGASIGERLSLAERHTYESRTVSMLEEIERWG